MTGINEESKLEDETCSGSTITPSEGYLFTKWTPNKDVHLNDGTEITANAEISSEQIKKVIPDDNITFTAHFEKIKFTVITSAENGTIDSNSTVEYGDNLTIHFTPDIGYKVDSVKVNSADAEYNEANGTITLTNIKENTVVKIICVEIPKYKVNTLINNGNITESSIVTADGNKLVSFAPHKYFHIESVKVNGANQEYEKFGDEYSFTLQNINENKDVIVTCKQDEHTITTYVINGTITAPLNVLGGEDATVNYHTKDGYELDYIKVDGTVVREPAIYMTNYTFKEVDKNHEIEVAYKEEYVPFTGDDTEIIYYSMLICSSIGIIFYLYKKKRKVI